MRKPLDPVQRLSQWLRKLESRVKTLETAPRLQNSSISKGALRILSPEGLIVVGSASVSGLLDVDGTLDGTGSFGWSGPWELSGAGQITGNVTATGTWTWQGDLNLSGDIDLTGGMTVRSGGDIVVQSPGGNLTLSSSYSTPRINFGGATQIEASGGVITITAGTTTVYIGDGGVRMSLPPRVGSGLPSGSVGADLDGTLWRAS